MSAAKFALCTASAYFHMNTTLSKAVITLSSTARSCDCEAKTEAWVIGLAGGHVGMSRVGWSEEGTGPNREGHTALSACVTVVLYRTWPYIERTPTVPRTGLHSRPRINPRACQHCARYCSQRKPIAPRWNFSR